MCLMAKRERFSAPLQREKLEIQERIYNAHLGLLRSEPAAVWKPQHCTRSEVRPTSLFHQGLPLTEKLHCSRCNLGLHPGLLVRRGFFDNYAFDADGQTHPLRISSSKCDTAFAARCGRVHAATFVPNAAGIVSDDPEIQLGFSLPIGTPHSRWLFLPY